MTLRQRLIYLIALLGLGFAAATGYLQIAESREQRELRASLQAEFGRTTDHIITLTGAQLKQFVDDYSWWDDMMNFVRAPDPAWAEVNLHESIDVFDVDVMWVVGLDGSIRFHVARDEFAAIALPVGQKDIVALVQNARQPWFFEKTEAGILEMRGAPIQPSGTVDRSDPAHGWFFVGRLWHPSRIVHLADTIGGTATIGMGLEVPPPPQAPNVLRVMRDLDDHRGRLIARLIVDKPTAALDVRALSGRDELVAFAVFGLFMVVLISIALRQWVLRPVQAIERSLQNDDPNELNDLIKDGTEFGRLARLVSASFAHKQQMAEAVSRRDSSAKALQQSELGLRQAIEERVKLGRDLHDSVIQTLYASGMGLATARNQLLTAPEDADNRLQVVQARLNETIRELRLFITGLEPEKPQTEAFSRTVTRLAEFVCEPNGLEICVNIDDSTAERLSPSQRAQLLQVIRETLSNVVRHADAHLVEVSLSSHQDHMILTIADDGRGLPAIEPVKSGRGINNIHERIAGMGGTSRLQAESGKGTRLTVTLRFTDASPK